MAIKPFSYAPWEILVLKYRSTFIAFITNKRKRKTLRLKSPSKMLSLLKMKIPIQKKQMFLMNTPQSKSKAKAKILFFRFLNFHWNFQKTMNSSQMFLIPNSLKVKVIIIKIELFNYLLIIIYNNCGLIYL